MGKTEIGLLVLFGVFVLGFGVSYLAVAKPLKRRLRTLLESSGTVVGVFARRGGTKSYRHWAGDMIADLRLVKFLQLYSKILMPGSEMVQAYCAQILSGNPPSFEDLLTPIQNFEGKVVSFHGRHLGFELWRVQRAFFKFLQEVPAACWADERRFERLAREYLEREKESRRRSGWALGGT